MNVIQLAIAASYARDLRDSQEAWWAVSRGLEAGPWYPQRESVAAAWERLCEISINIESRRQAMRSLWGEDTTEQIENYAYEMLDSSEYPYYNEEVEIRQHYGGREEGM